MFYINSYLTAKRKDPIFLPEHQELFDRINGRITAKFYAPDDSTLIAHIKIPSESVDFMKYDVVMHFVLPKDISAETNITTLPCRVFSNSPSFCYKYANVFYNSDMMIKWLTKKYDKITLKKEPVETNPDNTVGYEKSLYLACKYLSTNNKGRFGRIIMTAIKKIHISNLNSLIASQSSILTAHETVRTVKSNKRKDQISKYKNALEQPNRIKPTRKSSFSKVSSVSKIVPKKNASKKTKKI